MKTMVTVFLDKKKNRNHECRAKICQSFDSHQLKKSLASIEGLFNAEISFLIQKKLSKMFAKKILSNR